MAAESVASCISDPNFAVICSFLEKYGKICGIAHPNFLELQEMLENTQEVAPSLIDLHIKLLRKARKSVQSAERWEKALIKFCHSYSKPDGWEVERFGYKKSHLSVKLRLLKSLLEAQFDSNSRFKAEINRLGSDELRLQPIGRDKLGHTYWSQLDEDCHLRVYREDLDDESWEVVARDREGLIKLIGELSSNEPFNSELDALLNEDSNSQEIEKPITDTGQVVKSPSSDEDIDDEAEFEEIETGDEDDFDNSDDEKAAEKEVKSGDGCGQSLKNIGNESAVPKTSQAKLPETSRPTKDNGCEESDLSKKVSRVDRDSKASTASEPTCKAANLSMPIDDTVTDLSRKKTTYKTTGDEGDAKKRELESNSPSSSPVLKKKCVNAPSDGVGDAIEEPLMLVKGSGSGKDCNTCNPGDSFEDPDCLQENREDFICGDVIEEPLMFVEGVGSGKDCDTGNPGESSQTTVSSDKKEELEEKKVEQLGDPSAKNINKGDESKTESRGSTGEGKSLASSVPFEIEGSVSNVQSKTPEEKEETNCRPPSLQSEAAQDKTFKDSVNIKLKKVHSFDPESTSAIDIKTAVTDPAASSRSMRGLDVAADGTKSSTSISPLQTHYSGDKIKTSEAPLPATKRFLHLSTNSSQSISFLNTPQESNPLVTTSIKTPPKLWSIENICAPDEKTAGVAPEPMSPYAMSSVGSDLSADKRNKLPLGVQVIPKSTSPVKRSSRWDVGRSGEEANIPGNKTETLEKTTKNQNNKGLSEEDVKIITPVNKEKEKLNESEEQNRIIKRTKNVECVSVEKDGPSKAQASQVANPVTQKDVGHKHALDNTKPKEKDESRSQHAHSNIKKDENSSKIQEPVSTREMTQPKVALLKTEKLQSCEPLKQTSISGKKEGDNTSANVQGSNEERKPVQRFFFGPGCFQAASPVKENSKTATDIIPEKHAKIEAANVDLKSLVSVDSKLSACKVNPDSGSSFKDSSFSGTESRAIQKTPIDKVEKNQDETITKESTGTTKLENSSSKVPVSTLQNDKAKILADIQGKSVNLGNITDKLTAKNAVTDHNISKITGTSKDVPDKLTVTSVNPNESQKKTDVGLIASLVEKSKTIQKVVPSGNLSKISIPVNNPPFPEKCLEVEPQTLDKTVVSTSITSKNPGVEKTLPNEVVLDKQFSSREMNPKQSSIEMPNVGKTVNPMLIDVSKPSKLAPSFVDKSDHSKKVTAESTVCTGFHKASISEKMSPAIQGLENKRSSMKSLAAVTSSQLDKVIPLGATHSKELTGVESSNVLTAGQTVSKTSAEIISKSVDVKTLPVLPKESTDINPTTSSLSLKDASAVKPVSVSPKSALTKESSASIASILAKEVKMGTPASTSTPSKGVKPTPALISSSTKEVKPTTPAVLSIPAKEVKPTPAVPSIPAKEVKSTPAVVASTPAKEVKTSPAVTSLPAKEVESTPAAVTSTPAKELNPTTPALPSLPAKEVKPTPAAVASTPAKEVKPTPAVVDSTPAKEVKTTPPAVASTPAKEVKTTPAVTPLPAKEVKPTPAAVASTPAKEVKPTPPAVASTPAKEVKTTPPAVASTPAKEVKTTPAVTSLPAKEVKPTPAVVASPPAKEVKPTPPAVASTPAKEVKTTPPAVASTPAKEVKTTPAVTTLPAKEVKPTPPAVASTPVKEVKTTPAIPSLPAKEVKTPPPAVASTPAKEVKPSPPAVASTPAKEVKPTPPAVASTPAKEVKTTPPAVASIPAKDVKSTTSAVSPSPAKEVKTTPAVVASTPAKEVKPTPAVVASTPAKEVKPTPPAVASTPAKEVKPTPPAVASTPAREVKHTPPAVASTPAKEVKTTPAVTTLPAKEVKPTHPAVASTPAKEVKTTPPAVASTPAKEVKPTPPAVASTPAKEVKPTPPAVASTPAKEVKPTPPAVASIPAKEVKPTPPAVASTPAKEVKPTPPVVASTPAKEVKPTPSAVASIPAKEVKPTPPAVASTPAKEVKPTPPVVASTPAKEVKPTPSAVASIPAKEVKPTPPAVASTPAKEVKPTPPAVASTPAKDVKTTPPAVASTPAKEVKPTPPAVASIPAKEVKPTPPAVASTPAKEVKPTPPAVASTPAKEVKPTPPAVASIPAKDVKPIPSAVSSIPAKEVKPTTPAVPPSLAKEVKPITPAASTLPAKEVKPTMPTVPPSLAKEVKSTAVVSILTSGSAKEVKPTLPAITSVSAKAVQPTTPTVLSNLANEDKPTITAKEEKLTILSKEVKPITVSSKVASEFKSMPLSEAVETKPTPSNNTVDVQPVKAAVNVKTVPSKEAGVQKPVAEKEAQIKPVTTSAAVTKTISVKEDIAKVSSKEASVQKPIPSSKTVYTKTDSLKDTGDSKSLPVRTSKVESTPTKESIIATSLPLQNMSLPPKESTQEKHEKSLPVKESAIPLAIPASEKSSSGVCIPEKEKAEVKLISKQAAVRTPAQVPASIVEANKINTSKNEQPNDSKSSETEKHAEVKATAKQKTDAKSSALELANEIKGSSLSNSGLTKAKVTPVLETSAISSAVNEPSKVQSSPTDNEKIQLTKDTVTSKPIIEKNNTSDSKGDKMKKDVISEAKTLITPEKVPSPAKEKLKEKNTQSKESIKPEDKDKEEPKTNSILGLSMDYVPEEPVKEKSRIKVKTMTSLMEVNVDNVKDDDDCEAVEADPLADVGDIIPKTKSLRRGSQGPCPKSKRKRQSTDDLAIDEGKRARQDEEEDVVKKEEVVEEVVPKKKGRGRPPKANKVPKVVPVRAKRPGRDSSADARSELGVDLVCEESSVDSLPVMKVKKEVVAKPKTPKKTRKVLGLDIPIETEDDLAGTSGPPVRQSRRIAQIKIKEEADRREIEEVTLQVIEDENRDKKHKKNKKHSSHDYKSEKRKYKKNVVESSEEEYEATPDPNLKSSKKKPKKRKKDWRREDTANPWRGSSSGSSSSVEEEEEDQEQSEDDLRVTALKSDHEFSPESDLEDEAANSQPLRRARTAQKGESALEVAVDEAACQKCSKSDRPEWILLCDKCDAGWHCLCLRPALLVIPEGDWYCPPCQHTALIMSLHEQLKVLDRESKRKENEELRKKRLAYVGISLDNVLPKQDGKEEADSEAESVPERARRREPSRSSSSGSSSSGDESEPVYQLRERRTALFSYRFNEYDDLINSAIQDEMEAGKEVETVKVAGNQGRGKDIGNIIEAEKEEDREAERREQSGVEKAKEAAKESKTDNGDGDDEADPDAEPEVEDEEEEDGYIPPVRKFVSKKKHRKLNSLDINSEDDADSDEDFKGSSSDEEEEDYEEADSDDSDVVGRRRRGGRRKASGPIRRSGRARTTRFDRDFVDDDSYDSDKPVKAKKKARRAWDDTSDSEESDSTWGQRKRQKQTASRARAPRSRERKKIKKKKRASGGGSDAETFKASKPKKPRVKFGGLDELEDLSPTRRTRGTKINYVEMAGSDSEEEFVKPTKKKESEDEYVANEEEEEEIMDFEEEKEEEEEDEEEESENESENDGFVPEPEPEEVPLPILSIKIPPEKKEKLDKKQKGEKVVKKRRKSETLKVVKPLISDASDEEEAEELAMALEESMEDLPTVINEEELAKEQRRLEKEAKKLEKKEQKKKGKRKKSDASETSEAGPIPPQIPEEMVSPPELTPPVKRKGRGRGKASLAKAAAAIEEAAPSFPSAPTPPQANSVISRMLQSQTVAQPGPRSFTDAASAMGQKYFGERLPVGDRLPLGVGRAMPLSNRPPFLPRGRHPLPYRQPRSPGMPPHFSGPRGPHPAGLPGNQMYHTSHHPLDPSPSGGGPITIAGQDNLSLGGKTPPPPYSRGGPPPPLHSRFTVDGIASANSGAPPVRHPPPHFPPTTSGNHLQTRAATPPGRPPGNFSPYHQPPNYHYGAYPPPAPEDSLHPAGYQGSPYPETYTSSPLATSDGSNSKPMDEEGSGEFGGLVSYFSSQREDDLDA